MPSPVTLSADDAYHLERLADSMRRDAMDDYELFVSRDARRVDRSQWKSWKTHDGVALFRERSSAAASRAKRSGAAHSSKRLPRVLAVGAIRGSLDDVMYGIVTPTASAMRLKAAYLQHAEFLDAAVLHELQSATPSDPFRFLGLKWLLQRGTASSLLTKGLVRPRDFCYLEATGVDVVSAESEAASRVGYHVMHSVELPQCPERRDGGVQRGAFSLCALYHELPHGRGVDVYMTALVEPRGHMLTPMAMRSAERLLRTQWRALSVCAESKKLAWLLQTQRQLAADSPPARASSLQHERHCGFCSKALGALAKRRTCQLCSATVCAHCSVERTLRSPGLARDSVVASAMLFCKRCLAVASEENASEIARQELWETSVVRSGRAQTLLELATRRHDVASALVQSSVAAASVSSSGSGWSARHSLLHVPSGQSGSVSVSASGSSGSGSTYGSQPPPRATERGHHAYASRRSETAKPLAGDPAALRQSLPAKGFRRGSTTSNGTWLGSAYSRETLRTESLSLEGLDDSSLDAPDAVTSSILPPTRPSVQLYDPQDVPFSTASTRGDDDDGGRSSVASSASTALVLLNDRSALSRRLKELDYVDVDVDVDADLDARASSCAASELELDSSRGSFCSSIAVMDFDARRPLDRSNVRAFAFDEGDEPEDDAREYDLDQTPPRNNEFIPLAPMSAPLSAPASSPPLPLRRHNSASLLPPPPPAAPASAPETSPMEGDGPQLPYQMQLWLQMNELRDTAESTYQVARRNTETLLSQNPQLRHLQFFSPAPRVSGTTQPQPPRTVPVTRATIVASPPAAQRSAASTPRSVGRSVSVGARSEARFTGSLVL
ncbi:hypothetical protein P43SY_009396 [Pythium insidiosum]|uniref:FYVE-type domain-containing protein n=1 Tax=Pythium insidiosum TaxID=114742 RepID=A0AAD5LXZ5_PYTIN|nr:hypothetical protein P43SY_009396 [Pythium insidiosum]